MYTSKRFEGCFDEKAIKDRYRTLCKKHHPDLDGDGEVMKAINAAYEERMRTQYAKELDEEKVEEFMAQEKEMMEAVSKIISLKGIVIELIGRWVWVSGETKPNKEALKKAGFLFSRQKVAWYFRTSDKKFYRRNKPTKDLDELRETFKSQKVKGKAQRGSKSRQSKAYALPYRN
mgnify:CR=1 FL=1